MGEISFMDMLYSRYSNPMELVKTYIRRGRFGEFVAGFLQAEKDRRKAETKKDEDLKEWIAYVHSYSDKSFDDWKAEILGKASTPGKKTAGRDFDLDDKGIQNIIGKLFPDG